MTRNKMEEFWGILDEQDTHYCVKNDMLTPNRSYAEELSGEDDDLIAVKIPVDDA